MNKQEVITTLDNDKKIEFRRLKRLEMEFQAKAKIKNLLNAIIQQADNAKSNTIVDYETMKEVECKEIKLNLSVKAIEEIRKQIKEFE